MSKFALLVLFLCSVWAGQGHAENPMVLYRQAECMRDHADDYLAFVDGFTLIFPGFCEDGLYNPKPAEVAKGTSQNSSGSIAGSSIIDFTPADQAANAQLSKLSKNPKATAILVTPEMVACLKNRFDRVSLKRTFRTVSEKDVDVAELIFDLCR
ncbi:hypothetical protein [Roseovarius pacificus]|uniref:hypothetical protein n=1 Tax=Roseovarius pacificus TaxID=337701 RepID=UPI00403A1B4D